MNKQRFALVSVFDKTGIVEFARLISKLGYKIISTGGTAKVLKKNNIPVIPIQEITGNPESFDGRVKTISFEIEGGILFDRSKSSHKKQAKEFKIPQIDVVICNLYPFEQKQTIENIDVGGPTMIRAAAKNFEHVLVVVDPNDYHLVSSLLHKDRLSTSFRKKLAAKAFTHISLYDSQISNYLNRELFPKEITIPARLTLQLRYGENPHQKAALYLTPNLNSPFQNIQKQWGRELSLTNVADINAGIESVRLFSDPCAVVIKHNNPSGIALGKTVDEALSRAIEADPESAFGGTIVLNKKMDLKTAKVIGEFKDKRHANIDIVASLRVDKKALEYLQSVRKSMGIYTFGNHKSKIVNHKSLNIKWIDGGFILQTPDSGIEQSFLNWKTITKKKPTQKQLKQMAIAWKFISRIKSNAVIVVDKNLPMTRGIGTGQTSRVRSTKIALEQAGKYTKGAILASDSFFPFDDSVKLAAKAGITAIVQQGGSINDQLSINSADKAGIVMIFTHRRAFWH